MERSEEIRDIAMALSKFQGEVPTVLKASTNPFFKSKYADLSIIMETVKEYLSKNGLSITQTLEPSEKVRLATTLIHTSGQWISSTIELLPKDVTPQAYGSAITYARRYALSALIGVVSDEDDDGNAASMNKPINDKKMTVTKDDLPDIKVPLDTKIETSTRSDGVAINKKTGKPI